MEYLFIQIQHFLFICIFNLNFTFPTLIDLIPHSRMKAINVKQMTVEAGGGNFICVINYLNSSSVNFTLRERQ